MAANGWHAVQELGAEARLTKADLYYAHHRLRVETKGEPTVMIIDLPSGDLTLFNPTSKIYAQATLRDLVKMRDAMKQQMEARMASMPAEMKKRLEQMLKQQEEARKQPMKVKKVGKKGKVSGYACEYYDWTGPEGTGQACIATKLPVDLKPFQRDARKLTKALAETGAGSSAATNVELLQMAQYGLALETKKELSLGGRSVKSTSTLVKIEKATLPKTKFEAPKGLSKTSLEDFMRQAAQALR